MDAQAWSDATGVTLPKCKMQGCCCRAASPSKPFYTLLKQAADGDEFARNFFSIFMPHLSHQAADAVVPGIVERTRRAANKDEHFNGDDDIVFYHCRYIGADNTCQVWEDRPDLCRAHPDTPFVVLAPGCAFEPWAAAVKEKYQEIKTELARLKTLQSQIKEATPEEAQVLLANEATAENVTANIGIMLSLTPLYLGSPLFSFLQQ